MFLLGSVNEILDTKNRVLKFFLFFSEKDAEKERW